MHTMEMRMHLSDYQLCMRFRPLIITVTSVPVIVVLIVFIVIIFILNNLMIRVIPRSCIFNARSGLGESRQVKIVNSCYNCFRFPLAASAASLHCVLKAPARCEHVQLLPMLSPSALVVSLVANTDAKYLECFVQKILADFGM